MNISDFTLHGNRIVVEPETNKQDGGIVIPETVRKEVMTGTVVMVGDGNNIMPGIEIGCQVWYHRMSATPFPIEDKPCFILNGEPGRDIIFTKRGQLIKV
jgi:co-chaperonin GroES (HSP10)